MKLIGAPRTLRVIALHQMGIPNETQTCLVHLLNPCGVVDLDTDELVDERRIESSARLEDLYENCLVVHVLCADMTGSTKVFESSARASKSI